jgi:hypothetical protein
MRNPSRLMSSDNTWWLRGVGQSWRAQTPNEYQPRLLRSRRASR